MEERPSAFEFAHKLGVHTLYKFRGYRTREQREQVDDLLRGHRIYFARASQLDDQDDLRPLIRIRRQATEDSTRKMLLKDAQRMFALEDPAPIASELKRRIVRLRTASLDEIERDGMLRVHDRLDREYPIFCASQRWDSVKMWNAYPENCTGLCIHFDSSSGSPLGLSQKVIYRAKLGTVYVPIADEREAVQEAILTKALAWKDQAEFRFIRYPGVPFDEIGLRVDGQYGTFRSHLVTGITVGTAMNKQSLRRIATIAQRHDPPLPLFRPRGPIVQTPLESED